MAPARLRESDRGIVECTDRSPQKILRRDKVGVEDGDEGRFRLCHAVRESARFEPGARPSAQLSYADTLAAPLRDTTGENADRLVVGVIEHLDLKPIARPVDCADRVDDTLDDVALVVDGDLDADAWLAGTDQTRGRGVTQPERAHRQVKEVEAEGQQAQARRRQDRDRGRGDQRESKRAYGRIVERT